MFYTRSLSLWMALHLTFNLSKKVKFFIINCRIILCICRCFYKIEFENENNIFIQESITGII